MTLPLSRTRELVERRFTEEDHAVDDHLVSEALAELRAAAADLVEHGPYGR